MSDLAKQRQAARQKKRTERPNAERPMGDLDLAARAARVLGSQGRPQTIIGSLDGRQTEALAGCCDDAGNIVHPEGDTTVAQIVDSVLGDYYRAQKPRIDKGSVAVSAEKPDTPPASPPNEESAA